MPRFQKQATDASGLGGSGWRRSTESCARDRAGAFRAAYTRPCRRGPWATKHSSTLCHTQGATASRVARGFKRKRGSARALFDLGSATAQRADGGRPPRLRSMLAAIGAPAERCCNRHATLTGRPFRRLHLSPSLTLRRLLRCAKPSARRPIAIAARKKAGLGARCSRGDPRAHFSDGRACPSLLVY